MSEQMTFDRKKGFVALPVEILDIDLSPGAFRTLVELCRMANTDGFCWPSLGQLSDRMGRSKPAISGYVQELREAGLIDTEEQQMANGYNYRLKYRVTFWQAWRSSLVGKTAPKAECSVQSDERLKKLKNQSYKTQVREEYDSEIDQLLNDWARCFRGSPYPAARQTPEVELVLKTRQRLRAADQASPPISADIEHDLVAFWTDLRLSTETDDVSAQIKHLTKAAYTKPEISKILGHIRKAWPPHWRKWPTSAQFEKLVKASGVVSQASKLALLASYQKRWALAEKHLQDTPPFCSVNPKHLPSVFDHQAGKYPRI
ncbi:helix-turn-helix domain-containing protein [Roseobacter sp. A03A-229]